MASRLMLVSATTACSPMPYAYPRSVVKLSVNCQLGGDDFCIPKREAVTSQKIHISSLMLAFGLIGVFKQVVSPEFSNASLNGITLNFPSQTNYNVAPFAPGQGIKGNVFALVEAVGHGGYWSFDRTQNGVDRTQFGVFQLSALRPTNSVF